MNTGSRAAGRAPGTRCGTHGAAGDYSPHSSGATGSNAYGNRGAAYYMTKQYDKAIIDCTQAIKENQNSVFDFTNRANAYSAIRENDKARAD